jgi:phospholipase D1/2
MAEPRRSCERSPDTSKNSGSFMSEPRGSATLFEPGRNCWRVEHANRAAFIVDGDDYFKAFVAATRKAQRSILILGWDFHSRTRLTCGEDSCDALELGRYLNDLVRERPDLRVHILIWDYPMIFGLDREWAPIYGIGWKRHRRIQFRYDNTHPVGGSHHQKVVVIDDAIAFNGGIDLTARRWDTCAHKADDQFRVAQGTPYPPFHDLMMAVDGDAARALGDLARERWRRAVGETLTPPRDLAPRRGWRRHMRLRRRREAKAPDDCWPETLQPSVKDVDVALARTEPAIDGGTGVREVESLYIDMILAAKHSIYIENQYFTADNVGDALAQRLKEPDGPEVIVVIRELSHGWLEELTMETLRTRLIEKLRAIDSSRNDGGCRFRVVYPWISGLADGTCIDIHAKLIIVDDRFARIGSANFANRSMGLDTECDLTIDALGREDVADAIRDLRAELMGEHLGATVDEVEAAVARTRSLGGAIEALRRDDRTLRALDKLPEVSETVLALVAAADPEKPVALNDLTKIFLPDEGTKQRFGFASKVAMFVLGIVALMTLWKFTPLSALLEPRRITAFAREIGDRWWSPLIVLAAYTPAAFTMFPRPLITLFAVVAFGPWLGFVYALLGIELSAWMTFFVGTRLDRGTVRRVAGRKLNRMIEVLRQRGLLAITALRLVPLAPFAVEGIVAGAVRIKLWHFMLGTAIGILPGTLAATIFGNQLEAAMEDPGKVNYWLIGAAVAALVGATWAIRRWLISHSGDPHDVAPARTKSRSSVGGARIA